MEKNEVYDYLAKVYLDKQPALPANSGGKKRVLWKSYPVFLITALLIMPALLLLAAHPLKRFIPKSRGLYLSPANELINIKFNFTDSEIKKQGYAIALSGLDVSNFKSLQFRLRRLKKYGNLSLRVEMENKPREVASYYLTGIANKWQSYRIALGEFKEISQWDSLKRISFIVEEWNAENKEDCVYIDDIRFIRGEG